MSYGAFEPLVGIINLLEIGRTQSVDNISGGIFTNILRPQPREEGESLFVSCKYHIVDANWAVEKGFNRDPRAEVALGNISCMHQRSSAFFNSAFSRLSANAGSFGSFTSIVQSKNYEDDSGSADPTRSFSPRSLILGRFSGTPGYAKLGLMAVLGGLASVLINEAGIRGFHNRQQGRILLALSMVCIELIFCAALMFA